MTTVDLDQDLECFIRDAVTAGRYASAESVIKDALIQLRKSMGEGAPKSAPAGEPCGPGKQLTKQVFQRHLVKIGLLDQPVTADGDPLEPDQALIDDEGQIVSEVVIRERLIEWLTGFLEK